jgi:tRNA pseudouridine38-40 synthase
MRLALGIEYDGTDFQGWQKLSHGPTVQAEVESALSFVANAPTVVQCAGRTDSGVHALCQVVHFDTDAQRNPRGWVLGANSRLPDSISVRWAQPVADDFHARYAARARRYRYRILDRNIRPALQRRYVAWERLPLDADAMHRAAQALIGEHDFSAFRAVQCQARHAIRDMQEISVRRDNGEVVVDVRANAFLHHMVRNIVGSLLVIGRGESHEGWMGELLRGRDRTIAGATAPPQGLCFLGPLYPAQWGLPAEATL